MENQQNGEVAVDQIHEFWLNHELVKYMDQQQAHELEGEILETLNLDTDIECENRLV